MRKQSLIPMKKFYGHGLLLAVISVFRQLQFKEKPSWPRISASMNGHGRPDPRGQCLAWLSRGHPVGCPWKQTYRAPGSRLVGSFRRIGKHRRGRGSRWDQSRRILAANMAARCRASSGFSSVRSTLCRLTDMSWAVPTVTTRSRPVTSPLSQRPASPSPRWTATTRQPDAVPLPRVDDAGRPDSADRLPMNLVLARGPGP